MNQIHTKFGTIIKRETLSASKFRKRLKSLVLNSNDPYPGYYCDEDNPADNSCKLISYYIPLEETNLKDDDNLCRISLEMKEETGYQVCTAWFKLYGKNTRALRIKGIDENGLEEAIENIKSRKLKPLKHTDIKKFLSHIHLKAFFEIRELHDSIYQNTEAEGLFYFTIDNQLKWNDFERLITYQKSNSKFRNFDAAMGFWMEKPRLKDFIRIYGFDFDTEQLLEIRNEFKKNMREYQQKKILI